MARAAHLFIHNAAVVHHQHAVADEGNFGQFAGVQKNRRAVRRQFAQEGVNLPFGLNIDAARGIKAQQRAEARCQPPSDRHLLLVAARQAPHLGRGPGVDGETVDGVGRPGAFIGREAQPLPDARDEGYDQILVYRQTGQQGLQAVARDEDHPLLHRIGRRQEPAGTAVHQDPARTGPPFPAQDVEHPFLSLALQRHQAEDLAPANGKRDLADRLPRRPVPPRQRRSRNLQWLARRCRPACRGRGPPGIPAWRGPVPVV